MSFVTGLKCRECGQAYEIAAVHVCETCFGPLEVEYDYAGIARSLSRKKIEARPPNLWRYKELLPVESEPRIGLYSGFTPLMPSQQVSFNGTRTTFAFQEAIACTDAESDGPSKMPQPCAQAYSVPERLTPRKRTGRPAESTSAFP